LIAEGALAATVTHENENKLAFSLAAYLSMTKSYALTEKATKANHFVVIRYGRIGTLRPFVMTGSARHLLLEQKVAEAIQNVVTLDAKNHPDFVS
jgi:hypothetical protein